MKIGIGLPSTMPGVSGEVLVEWARRAERRGFSSLVVVDRLVYANYDPLVALAAAAAVTDRIGLCSAVILAPLRASHAEFAKQAASIDHLSGGRLTLGLAVGSRRDDYEAAGVDFSRRGRLFDELLATSSAIWRGEGPAVGPEPVRPGGPELLIGGGSPATFRRLGTYRAGWVSGTGGPDVFAEGLARARSAYEQAGLEGAPRGVTLSYFALGEGADDAARATLGSYYSYRGEPVVSQIVNSAVTSAEAIRARAEGFAEAGCDEILFAPVDSDPDQVDRLADVFGLG